MIHRFPFFSAGPRGCGKITPLRLIVEYSKALPGMPEGRHFQTFEPGQHHQRLAILAAKFAARQLSIARSDPGLRYTFPQREGRAS